MAKSKARVPTTMVPLTAVKLEDITEFDVRIERKNGTRPIRDPAAGERNSLGNIRYRTIIRAAVSQFYAEKSVEGKSIIAQHVLEDLGPGRMLQFLAQDGFFHYIGDEASLRKVHKDFSNVSRNMMRKEGKKPSRVGAKTQLRRSAPPRGVTTKSAKETPPVSKGALVVIKKEEDAPCIDLTGSGGEADDASSGDPYSTSVEAESLEATARRLETENSTLLRERIEELTKKNQKLRRLEKENANLLKERIEDLTAKNQKLRKEKYSTNSRRGSSPCPSSLRMECADSDGEDDNCRIGTGSIQPGF